MKINKAQKSGVAIWAIGVITMLFGAFVMFHGSLFGENNSGIAIIIGIIGMGLVVTGIPLWTLKKK